MAMLLTKLKSISEKELATKVTDCVVSVSILTTLMSCTFACCAFPIYRALSEIKRCVVI